mmetsp:Transcript_6996/g.12614  ORF Transcript_6996/g.12614 Transcript_6996/m.12614 type:complete len:185 (+) Transcript_6996:445-999(+)
MDRRRRTRIRKTTMMLWYAAETRYCGKVLKFINKGAIVNYKFGTQERTLLHRAAWNGDVRIAHMLLCEGANINSKDKCRYTPLHVAAKKGNHDVVEMLLDHEAKVDSKDSLQKTPLHLAVRNDREDIVRLLLERGADIHTKDFRGKTLLEYAVQAGNADIVDLILETLYSEESELVSQLTETSL